MACGVTTKCLPHKTIFNLRDQNLGVCVLASEHTVLAVPPASYAEERMRARCAQMMSQPAPVNKSRPSDDASKKTKI